MLKNDVTRKLVLTLEGFNDNFRLHIDPEMIFSMLWIDGKWIFNYVDYQWIIVFQAKNAKHSVVHAGRGKEEVQLLLFLCTDLLQTELIIKKLR